MNPLEKEYESPSVEVVDVYSEEVICTSGNISIGGFPDWPEVYI